MKKEIYSIIKAKGCSPCNGPICHDQTCFVPRLIFELNTNGCKQAKSCPAFEQATDGIVCRVDPGCERPLTYKEIFRAGGESK